jgi:hypothetical protein
MRLVFFLLLALLPACATFPALDETIDPAATKATFPDFVPFETFVTTGDDQTAAEVADDLTLRAAVLENRAEQLRNSAVQ